MDKINKSSDYYIKTIRWADYKDDDLLPVIPWKPNIKQYTYKTNESSEWKTGSSEWITVKSKNKRR